RGRAQIVGGGRAHLPPRQALFLRRRAYYAQAGAAADPGLCGIVFQALDRIGGTAQLRPDRRPLRRRHELRRLATGRRPLSRELRQIRQPPGTPDVQLFHPLRRHEGAGGRAARAPNPLLPRVRDPRAARRSENRAAELSLFCRHGRALAEGQAGRLDRKLGPTGLAAADHGHPQEGGGRRIFGGDPLLQRRPQAAPAGEGRDGALYARGRTGLRRRTQAKGGLGAPQPRLMNVPSFNSAKARCSSALVFITIGPYQATGSSIGLPDTNRNRTPSSPACTVISSPLSNSTSERFPVRSRISASFPSTVFSVSTPNGCDAELNVPEPSNT